MNTGNSAKTRPFRLVSSDDERQKARPQPAHAPPAPVICITGSFDDIEDEYLIDYASPLLGSGHHGSVRECVNRTTGRRYAVKTILKNRPGFRPDGVVGEISMLREANHECVVRLHDVREDAERVHLVTDLCRGGELFDRIVERVDEDDGPACFAEREAARVVCRILEAASHLHRRNIVHRDIKPENVLFESAEGEEEEGDDRPSVRLVDFGLSRRHRSGSEPAMTAVVGTPHYIAPEVLRRRYDRACDLWSVGVVAYVLLSGRHPFEGADRDEIHQCVLRGRYHFPEEGWERVGAEAVDFVRRLLQVDPRRRMTAEQALRHPWIMENCRDMIAERERQELARTSALMTRRTRTRPRTTRTTRNRAARAAASRTLATSTANHAERITRPKACASRTLTARMQARTAMTHALPVYMAQQY